eukprot:9358717-Heterocapsa_arctica.AAC.1
MTTAWPWARWRWTGSAKARAKARARRWAARDPATTNARRALSSRRRQDLCRLPASHASLRSCARTVVEITGPVVVHIRRARAEAPALAQPDEL